MKDFYGRLDIRGLVEYRWEKNNTIVKLSIGGKHCSVFTGPLKYQNASDFFEFVSERIDENSLEVWNMRTCSLVVFWLFLLFYV